MPDRPDHGLEFDQLRAESCAIDAARREPAAFEALYAAHYPWIASYLYRRTADHQLTDELASQTLAAAWHALPRFRAGITPLRCWLLRIATNQLRSWNRSHRRSRDRLTRWAGSAPSSTSGPGTNGSFLDNDPHTRAAISEDIRRALFALDSLPNRYRDALALHYLADLSVDHVALVLGCPAGTVKSHLSRGRDLLRRELERRERADMLANRAGPSGPASTATPCAAIARSGVEPRVQPGRTKP